MSSRGSVTGKVLLALVVALLAPPTAGQLASDAREGWDRALILFHQEKFHEAFEALQGVVRMTDGKLGYDHWVRRLLRYPCTHRARARARAHTHTHTHCT